MSLSFFCAGIKRVFVDLHHFGTSASQNTHLFLYQGFLACSKLVGGSQGEREGERPARRKEKGLRNRLPQNDKFSHNQAQLFNRQFQFWLQEISIFFLQEDIKSILRPFGGRIDQIHLGKCLISMVIPYLSFQCEDLSEGFRWKIGTVLLLLTKTRKEIQKTPANILDFSPA